MKLKAFLLLQAARATATELLHWPQAAAESIERMIESNRGNKDVYAVFDMDNTSYRNDATESLLAYMDAKGLIARESLDPSLKLIDFKDSENFKEGWYSYYLRLCEINELICYPWIAQAFSGFTLENLKMHLDAMMKDGTSIPATYYTGDTVTETLIAPPKPTPGMLELYARLQEEGIKVYVITAGSEEIVRMIASDPQYGYKVPPEQVIGVNVLLKDSESGNITNSRWQIEDGTYNQEASMKLHMTAYLVNPMTWFEGKLGTIYGYINQWQKAVLVAGDTPGSDGYMLLNGVDLSRNGVRLWVDRKIANTDEIRRWRNEAELQQASLGQEPSAGRGWVEVTPAELEVIGEREVTSEDVPHDGAPTKFIAAVSIAFAVLFCV